MQANQTRNLTSSKNKHKSKTTKHIIINGQEINYKPKSNRTNKQTIKPNQITKTTNQSQSNTKQPSNHKKTKPKHTK